MSDRPEPEVEWAVLYDGGHLRDTPDRKTAEFLYEPTLGDRIVTRLRYPDIRTQWLPAEEPLENDNTTTNEGSN